MSWRGVPTAASALLLAQQVVYRFVVQKTVTAREETDNFKLLFWQSLCIVLELCDDALAPPTSLKGCKAKLEKEVFVNIAQFVSVIRSNAPLSTITRYQSRAALRKAIRTKGPLFPKKHAKAGLLQPLLIELSPGRR